MHHLRQLEVGLDLESLNPNPDFLVAFMIFIEIF